MFLVTFSYCLYFNPRSHERSDPSIINSSCFSSDFNPRSHERSDAKIFSLLVAIIISIHAPTRGATVIISGSPCGRLFQSTLPREERQGLSAKSKLPFYFNPRSHERSDPLPLQNRLQYVYFNPRSHERSDRFITPNYETKFISIHAPTRGATGSSLYS